MKEQTSQLLQPVVNDESKAEVKVHRSIYEIWEDVSKLKWKPDAKEILTRNTKRKELFPSEVTERTAEETKLISDLNQVLDSIIPRPPKKLREENTQQKELFPSEEMSAAGNSFASWADFAKTPPSTPDRER